MRPTSEERIRHSGLQLHLYRWQADGIRDRLMIISHGLGEHARRYNHVAAYFIEQGYEVVGFDHQGHGRSEGKRGRVVSVESLVDETAAVLAAVDGPQYRHRVLWAHSMGGLIALEALRSDGFAERLSAAVVTSPALKVVDEPAGVLKSAIGLLAKVIPNVAAPNGLDARQLSLDPAVAEDYRADPLNHDRMSFRLAHGFFSIPKDLLSKHTASDLPLLLMHGTEDGICAVEGSRAYVASNQGAPIVYREWPGLRHELHNEAAQKDILDVACVFLEEQFR